MKGRTKLKTTSSTPWQNERMVLTPPFVRAAEEAQQRDALHSIINLSSCQSPVFPERISVFWRVADPPAGFPGAQDVRAWFSNKQRLWSISHDEKMTIGERRKCLRLVKPRYSQAGRKEREREREQFLDEMQAVAGLERKTLIQSMNNRVMNGAGNGTRYRGSGARYRDNGARYRGSGARY
jgi:hypothetical protein